MLSVALKILFTLGILLLCLLGLVLLLILLVLFFPVCYRLTGKKDSEQMTVSARAVWLFGLLRVRFDYPEPGRVLVKILPFTVFDSGKQTGGKTKKDSGGDEKKAGKDDKAGKEQTQASEGGQNPAEAAKQTVGGGRNPTADAERAADRERDLSEAVKQTAGGGRNPTADVERTAEGGRNPAEAAKQAAGGGQNAAADACGDSSRTAADSEGQQDAAPSESAAAENEPPDKQDGEDTDSAILKKFKKIKYTICSIYDKIKNIWENISYYIDLLQEEETKLLFSHVLFRLGKILKSIRPRHMRGQILFGTGSPDTTGYACGVYGMLSPFLGNRLCVTPDFTGAVLEGDICIRGHITVFTIVWNGLRVLSDKELRRFIKKMKAGRKK